MGFKHWISYNFNEDFDDNYNIININLQVNIEN